MISFVSIFTIDSALVVKRVFPYFNHHLMVNDTIIELLILNGTLFSEFVEKLICAFKI